MSTKPSANPLRDINLVLADNAPRLLTISGVVGVYVGLQSDQRTQCLKVMLDRADQKLKRAIPSAIEGYYVTTEITGEIRPLNPR